MNREMVLELLQDEALLAELTARESAESSVGQVVPRVAERFRELCRLLRSTRFVVPIFGLQGTGKSTLLNALLFDEPVLPVDADETTSIPVEIWFGAKPDGTAEVRFCDGRREFVAATEAGLRPFVHHHANPDNRLGVDRIVIQCSSPLLRDGLVLVDLPGTGSMSKRNGETATNYLKEAVSLLYLLRTVPPLTRSESIRLVGAWARCPRLIAVQNQWTDEGVDEVKQGREHNETTLAALAKANRIPLESAPSVLVVNAFEAFRSRLRGDASRGQASGIQELFRQLEDSAKRAPASILATANSFLRAEMASAVDSIRSELASVNASEETFRRAAAEDEQRFRAYRLEAQRRVDEGRRRIARMVAEQVESGEAWAAEFGPKMRSAMRSKVKSGLLDGPRLRRALEDEQRTALESLAEAAQQRLLQGLDDVRVQFDQLPSWRLAYSGSVQLVDRPEASRPGNLAPPIAGSVGALAGSVAAGAAAGSFGGPIGAIIGGGIGGLVGAFFGKELASKVVEETRASEVAEVNRLIAEAIEGFVAANNEQLRVEFLSIASKVEAALDSWLTQQEARYETERKRAEAGRATQGIGREQHLAALERSLALVAERIERLAGVGA